MDDTENMRILRDMAMGRDVSAGDRVMAASWVVREIAGGADILRAVLAAPAPVVLAGDMINAIASEWDGCIYEATGEDIDIGAAIRSAYQRLLAAPAPEQRERVELTDAEIADIVRSRCGFSVDAEVLFDFRAVIAAHEAKRASWSQNAKKTTHEAGRVDETGKNEHVGGAA